ncbi:amino acid permease [Neisseria gonorrhoeae]|uniref:amino acid permease n=1 Tax=Neisseria gonorrhoeae TaxID=485 RepID=UPI00148443FA|nr:amino acid permease [Neisseria gonorrhoeae]GFL76048.1 amino acid permease [Neisseria gonorrhoeae]
MNNMFAAKLSELVYTASDHPDSLSEMEEFDRLILLIRKLYQILDGQHTLYRVTVCLNYRSRRGLIALDKAAVGCDAAMLRARRWRICMQIAERLSESVGRTVAAESVSAACPELEGRYLDLVRRAAVSFGFAQGQANPAGGQEETQAASDAVSGRSVKKPIKINIESKVPSSQTSVFR